ncbi:PqqD family protein [Agromyces sp. M3QZ16-3]|uniref:PqqD family protein n=1 Tax=Agromyces sp. M3QZ16-3 TaxID=3447585 RepID=UPI003F6929A9
MTAIGATVRIGFAADVPEETRARVADAWADATVTADDTDAVVEVDSDGPVESMLERLSVRVTLAALAHQRGALIMMHAAGVAMEDGRVIAFVGPSGRGKTTLSATLGAQFGYVSDETVAVDRDLTVHAYRKPLSKVRPNGPKEQVAPRRAGLMDLPAAPLRLAALVLLDRQPGVSEPELTRVPVIDAIAELVPQLSYVTDIEAPLQRLAALCDAVGGVWRMTYGEAASVVPLIPELLGASPADAGSWRPLASNQEESGVGTTAFRWGPVSDAIAADESVAVMSGGVFRVLAGIAPSIWVGIGNGLRVEELVAQAIAEFGEPAEGDASDLVAAVIDELVREGLLVSQATVP